MDKKIIETLEELKKSISEIKSDMVTKKDAKQFLTKTDAKNFATKDDLKNFATKDDLKTTLANHPTKDDLKNFGESLVEDMSKVMHDLIVETDEQKVTREDLKNLENRVDIIEQKLAQ